MLLHQEHLFPIKQLAFGLIGLPLALARLLDQASLEMRERTSIAPLLLGAKGSESDLVFGTMFFASTPPAGLAMRDLARPEAAERLADLMQEIAA